MNKKIIAGSVIGVFGLLLFAGNSFAATTISGNGVGSVNKTNTKHSVYMSKKQTNVSTFLNSVNTKTNTGWNKTNFNTGGTNSASGGSADTTVTIANMAGANVSEGDSEACCCDMTPGTNTISGNGAFSYNKITEDHKCVVKSEQTNVTTIVNSVNTVTNTGGNSSSFNTGSGSSATGGDATTEVNITNAAGLNVSM